MGLMVAGSSVVRSFFFSSRRRHTRSLCDWSSDVCSSDLGHVPNADGEMLAGLADRTANERKSAIIVLAGVADGKVVFVAKVRSEERRVGKECRSRWWRYHEKKIKTKCR